jgi:hypothetical protein
VNGLRAAAVIVAYLGVVALAGIAHGVLIAFLERAAGAVSRKEAR